MKMLDDIDSFLSYYVTDDILNGMELVVYSYFILQGLMIFVVLLTQQFMKFHGLYNEEEEPAEEDEYLPAEDHEESEAEDEEQHEVHRGERVLIYVPARRRAVPVGQLGHRPAMQPALRPGRFAIRNFRYSRRNRRHN